MGVELIVAGGNRAGEVVPVSTGKFIIGRATDCHLRPTSELISRYHCALLVDVGVVVRDLGSRNGVRLNGEKISAEQKINNGDRLGVGPLEFFVHVSEDEIVIGLSEGTNTAWNQSPEEVGDTTRANQRTVLMDPSTLPNQETK